MQIAFIGYGNVGGPLADHLQRQGHTVTLAAIDFGSDSVVKLRARNPALQVATPREAVKSADVVFLATPFAAGQQSLAAVGEEISGKILVDCTNPIGPDLKHGLDNALSGSEFIQGFLPATHVIKAFSIYGFENLEDNSYSAYNVKPVMMYCGNDAVAKATVAQLIEYMGWQPLDVGGLEQALHLEHMTLLWIRMVRAGKYSPHLVWAAMTR